MAIKCIILWDLKCKASDLKFHLRVLLFLRGIASTQKKKRRSYVRSDFWRFFLLFGLEAHHIEKEEVWRTACLRQRINSSTESIQGLKKTFSLISTFHLGSRPSPLQINLKRKKISQNQQIVTSRCKASQDVDFVICHRSRAWILFHQTLLYMFQQIRWLVQIGLPSFTSVMNESVTF